MANQHFSINRQLFEIDFFSKAKAYELQDRISRLVNGPLPEQANRYLESVIPEELLLKIDQISLDIGEVNFENLEQELLAKFMDALMEEIATRLRLINDPGLSKQAGITVTHAYSGHADLLEYFLLTGSLPWWAEQSTGIESVLDTLFRDHRALLRELLLRTGRYEYVRQRIVNNFREVRIRNIIETLEPVEAEYIFGYHSQVTRLQQKEQVVKTEEKTFEKEVWLFILNYLLADRGGEFNRKDFVKNNLMQIAARFNISYRELLLLFFKALKIELSQKSHETSLLRVIEELVMNDNDIAVTKVITPEIQAEEKDTNDLHTLTGIFRLFRYYFEFGTLPAWADTYTHEDLADLLLLTAGKAPETLSELLFSRDMAGIITGKVFGLLGTFGTRELLLLIHPAGREISRIATAFEILQSGKLLVNANDRDFTDTIWNILLNVTMVFGLSAVAGPVIIEAVIHRLQKQYDVQPEQLAVNLKEAILERGRQPARNIPGLEHVKAALQSYVSSATGRTEVPFSDNLPDITDTARGSATLRDLLRFLLDHGAMPWWGKQYTGTSATALLSRLLATDAYDALWIFQWAYLSPSSKKRFLQSIPEALLLDLVQRLPVASPAIRLFRQAKIIVGEVFPDLDPVLLPEVLWDELADHKYHYVSLTGFYTKLISRISALPGYDAKSTLDILQDFTEAWSANEVIEELQQWLASFRHEYKRKPTVSHIQKSGDAFLLQEYLLSASVMTAIPQGSNEIKIVHEWLQTTDETTRIAITDRLFYTLRYYVDHGRLPAGTAGIDQVTVKMLLHKLLVLAFYTDPQRLRSLFETNSVNDRQLLAIAQLAGVLKSDDDPGKEVFSFLYPFITKQVYPFDQLYKTFMGTVDELTGIPVTTQRNGKRFPLDTSLSFIENDPDARDDEIRSQHEALIRKKEDEEDAIPRGTDPAETPEPDEVSVSGVHNIYTVVLPQFIEEQFLQQNAAADLPAARIAAFFLGKKEITRPEELYEAALVILNYFLLWNRLPSVFNTAGDSKQSELIRDLLRFAFRRNRQALKQVVYNDEYQPAAIIRLFSILERDADPSDKEVIALLAPLKQKAFRLSLAHPDITPALNYLKEQQADAMAVIASLTPGMLASHDVEKLFSSDAALTAVSEYHELWLFSQLMTQSSYQPVPQFQPLMQHMFLILEHAFTDSLVREKMIRLYKLYNLKMAASKQSFSSSYEYFLAFFRFAGEHQSPATIIWQQVLGYLSDTSIVSAETLPAETADMRRALRFLLGQEADRRVISNDIGRKKTNTGGVSGNTEPEQDVTKEKIREELLRAKEREQEAEKKQAQEKMKDRKTKLYISNAGLVILHPFFSTYFSRLGLQEKGRFHDPAKQERGVLLMQYLVSGRVQFEEHELALNKILCGMDTDTPVAVEITLTDEEQRLSDELFEVLIQQWSKLKNSSVQGIRASFLQREGGLEEVEDGWLLRVEQRGYDMLLQTLPWGYGFIKTPWMKKILTVEWI